MATFEELLGRWDGEEAVIRYHAGSDSWIFICLHSTGLGPGGGGTRMKVYDTPADGLEDAMRLSAAMTMKMAIAGVPFGGAKAVLAVPALPRGGRRRALLHAYGDLVASLRGSFNTGADMNTTVEDMDVIGERTPHVFGRSEANGGAGDPGPYTAAGVYHGIRASLARVCGSPEVRGRTILVQGTGSVGGPLAAKLAREGARVVVADLDAERAAATAESIGGTTVSADEVLTTECDVFAPCAVGRQLSVDTVPKLRCRIVAGSANDQLTEPQAAESLRAAGILYAPDYVINAGGVIGIVGLETLGWSRDEAEAAVARIGDTLSEIYGRAESDGVTTAAAADALAARRLAAA